MSLKTQALDGRAREEKKERSRNEDLRRFHSGKLSGQEIMIRNAVLAPESVRRLRITRFA